MSMRKGLIILGDLQDQDMIWLSRSGRVHRLEPGDHLIEAGRDIDDLFIVTDGWLSVQVDGAELAEVGTGDVLGEMSFVEKRPTSAAVVAKSAARALGVPRQALLDEFKTNTGFAARFYRALAVFLSDRLRSMTTDSERGQVDEGILDQMHVAGDRLLRLIDLLEGRATVD